MKSFRACYGHHEINPDHFISKFFKFTELLLTQLYLAEQFVIGELWSAYLTGYDIL
jgi:hypothetical protein